MKISTSFLFDRATERMSNIQNRLATTQAQMAESKQILSPSDAPDQAAAIQRLKGEVQRQDSHMRTLDVAIDGVVVANAGRFREAIAAPAQAWSVNSDQTAVGVAATDVAAIALVNAHYRMNQ